MYTVQVFEYGPGKSITMYSTEILPMVDDILIFPNSKKYQVVRRTINIVNHNSISIEIIQKD